MNVDRGHETTIFVFLPLQGHVNKIVYSVTTDQQLTHKLNYLSCLYNGDTNHNACFPENAKIVKCVNIGSFHYFMLINLGIVSK
jgi:hypothetical protein